MDPWNISGRGWKGSLRSMRIEEMGRDLVE